MTADAAERGDGVPVAAGAKTEAAMLIGRLAALDADAEKVLQMAEAIRCTLFGVAPEPIPTEPEAKDPLGLMGQSLLSVASVHDQTTRTIAVLGAVIDELQV